MSPLSHLQSGLLLLLISILALALRSRARKIENSPNDASHPSHSNTLPQRTARPITKPEKPTIEETPEIQEILHRLENTTDNIFLTGKAGTGKSTILKYFLNITQKNYAVVAPTGIAAVNVNGQTIHSFFGFSPNIAPTHVRALTNSRLELVEQLDCLIIDEISMVRADLLKDRKIDRVFVSS